MITQRFPFLAPIRAAQRKALYYAGMRLDGRTYAKTQSGAPLPHTLFSAPSGLYNAHTGFDPIYQENKAFNLKLAAEALNGLLIRPGETFSLWQAVRHADRRTPYREGLVVRDGRLGVAYGGGLCQMSNLLFWVFLHAPLTLVERHTHKVKDFPTMRGAEPEGVDATISEGWLDLKVKNETDITFQIALSFDAENITGSLLTDQAIPVAYEIDGRELAYFYDDDGAIHQRIAIYRREVDPAARNTLSEALLYTNRCIIGYRLPEGTEILTKGGVRA